MLILEQGSNQLDSGFWGMKNIKTTIITVALLSFTATVVAGPPREEKRCHGENTRRCVSAPEIDPAQAMSALLLLSGTVAIIRGRRGKK
jgi:hypothetical protein